MGDDGKQTKIFEDISPITREEAATYLRTKDPKVKSKFEKKIATIQEKLDGNTITFTVESSIDTDSIKEEDVTNDMPVSSGEYVFTFDGDYIVYKAQDAKRTSNPFSTYILIAICDYYGMNWVTANEYICAHPDNTYYIIDTDANTIKIYAVNNWKMD